MKVWLMILIFCLPAAAWAKANGIAANGCSGCHGGNQTHAVTFASSVGSPTPGSVVTLTITLKGTGAVGGFYLRNGGVGTFANLSNATRLVNGEVVHASPRAASGGQVVFQVQWSVPSTPGGADFEVYSVLGNGNNASSGDSTAYNRFNLLWGCAGVTLYGDFDLDGYGSTLRGTTQRCAAQPGFAPVAGDCDDNDEQIHPNAIEACNGKDDNCNGQIDEGLTATTTWPDLDHDGYGAINGTPASGCATASRAPNNTDCDDTNPKVHPGAAEVCNGFDDNCEGRIDEGVQIRCGVGLCARFGPTCDPAFCTPGAPKAEVCNGLDDDCNGIDDDGAPCPAGQTCLLGQCLDNDADGGPPTPVDGGPNPAVDGGVGGGGGTPGSDACPGCSSGSGLFAAAGLVLLLSRRNRGLNQ